MWSDKNPGLNIRDWLHVEDNCKAIWFVSQNGNEGEIYNIGGENERTNIDMTKQLLNYFNYGEEMIEKVTHRKGHDFRYSINTQKLKGLGFKFEHSKLEEEIPKLCKWYENYLYAPSINSELIGVISEIDDVRITSLENLGETLEGYSPGDKINIKTSEGNYEIVLDEHPENPEKAWLGIVFEDTQRRGAFGKVINFLTSFREPHVFYEAKFQASEFIYNFLWWLVLISFSVALVNMLPMGIFDGGRFFYLTIWGLTKSEEKAKKWFVGMTYFLLFLLMILMIFWAFSFVG